MSLTLKARINRSDAGTIRYALEQLPAKRSVRKASAELIVELRAEYDHGFSDLNRKTARTSATSGASSPDLC